MAGKRSAGVVRSSSCDRISSAAILAPARVSAALTVPVRVHPSRFTQQLGMNRHLSALVAAIANDVLVIAAEARGRSTFGTAPIGASTLPLKLADAVGRQGYDTALRADERVGVER